MPSFAKADPLPLSLLNDFLYCPRRAALKIVEVAIRTIGEVRQDRDHELRRRFDAFVSRFIDKLKSARIWGTGVHDGQTIGREHVLNDKDIVELHI